MRKWFAVLALVVVGCTACDDTPPLTVQAYADQCAIIRRDEADPATFSLWWQWHDWLFNHVDAFEQLNPPDELADYHRRYIDVMSVFRDLTSIWHPDHIVSHREILVWELRWTQTKEPRLHKAYAALSDDIRQILHDAGCRELDDASSG